MIRACIEDMCKYVFVKWGDHTLGFVSCMNMWIEWWYDIGVNCEDHNEVLKKCLCDHVWIIMLWFFLSDDIWWSCIWMCDD